MVDFVTLRHTDLTNTVFFCRRCFGQKEKRQSNVHVKNSYTEEKVSDDDGESERVKKKNMHDIDVQMKQKVLCFACEKPSSLCPVSIDDQPKRGVKYGNKNDKKKNNQLLALLPAQRLS